ncbi:MAG TPA: DMT family transporter [Bacillota bacterium]|nr:DMT family transporter [Bacillota bacterium]
MQTTTSARLWSRPLIVMLLATSACFLWGTAFPGLKLSYQALGIRPQDIFLNILFASYRFFLASLMLLLAIGLSGISIKLPEKGVLRRLLLLGLIQTTLQYVLFYVGLSATAGVKASILGGTSTFFSVVMAHFIYENDRLSWSKILGLIAGFSGLILVNLGKGGITLEFALAGEGLLVLSYLAGSIANFPAKGLSQRLNPLVVTFYQMFLGSLMLFALAVTKESPGALHFSVYTSGLLLWLAFLSAAAFGTWTVLLKYNAVGKISLYQFLIPVFGTISSALLVPGEKLTPTVLGALLLVSVGILAVNRDKESAHQEPESPQQEPESPQQELKSPLEENK